MFLPTSDSDDGTVYRVHVVFQSLSVLIFLYDKHCKKLR